MTLSNINFQTCIPLDSPRRFCNKNITVGVKLTILSVVNQSLTRLFTCSIAILLLHIALWVIIIFSIIINLLSLARIPTAGVGPDWPANIYLTFQFYRFSPVTSQQLTLLTSDKVQQKASAPLPCVLASINKDGTVNSGKDPPLVEGKKKKYCSFSHWNASCLQLVSVHLARKHLGWMKLVLENSLNALWAF